jgi:integrase
MPGRRQRGEGSLFRRSSDGRWVARAELGWRDGKRDQRLFVAATPDEALTRREAFLATRRDGFTPPKGRPAYTGEWMLHWLNVIAKRKVAETTWEKSYRQKVTELIVPFFERIPLPELCEDDIEAWHAWLEEKVSERTGKPLSPSTIGQAHRIMSRAIKVAVARGRLPRNPLSNVTPPQADEPDLELPGREDVTRILDRCETWPGGARWVLAITTGLRQGERLALEWKRDVRLRPPASVTVHKSAARVRGERIVKTPKSASSLRSVPLGRRAVRLLTEHRKAQMASIGDLVFTDPKGQPLHPRADWQDWQNLLAGLGLPGYRVHDCRHVYGTILLEEGVDARVVQEMMGWSAAAVRAMLKRYQHVRPVLHQQVADVLDRVFGE